MNDDMKKEEDKFKPNKEEAVRYKPKSENLEEKEILNETIDNENIPMDMPENETCKMLDDLYAKNQLNFRKVRYKVSPSQMTDSYDECTYDNRKFIRFVSQVDGPESMKLSNDETIKKDQAVWIEVKPIASLFSKTDSTRIM